MDQFVKMIMSLNTTNIGEVIVMALKEIGQQKT